MLSSSGKKPLYPVKPEYHYSEEFQNRSAKLAELQEIGIQPYPHKFSPTASAGELQRLYTDQEVGSSEEAEAGSTPKVYIAGRIVLFRAMGKNAFAQLQDGSGRIQFLCNRDHTSVTGYSPKENDPKPIKLIEKKIDLGDIVGLEGHLFRTQKGELTLYVTNFTLLAKSLLPLPDKHAGLHDKETRYRKRWLDLLVNEEVQSTFRLRSQILAEIRQFFAENQFVEVETPILQSVYGGAEARPFTTHLHALEQDMYMRISLEPSLKKLVVGGMERVFEIGKVFRNEGIDRNHNPEFTLLEAYATYWDYNDLMLFVESLYEHLAKKLLGTTKIPITLPGQEEPYVVDVAAPWKRLTMNESLKEYGNIDADAMTNEEMRAELQKSEHIDEAQIARLTSRGLLIQALFEIHAEPHLMQPHHILDHPRETTPLCKEHRDPDAKEAGLIERFESFILGQELCNGYSELNDPIIQRGLLEEQAARREAGDEEASPLDEEFLEAICQGMPPTAGFGTGIDRMVMLFSNSHSIRDVILFPWMRP